MSDRTAGTTIADDSRYADCMARALLAPGVLVALAACGAQETPATVAPLAAQPVASQPGPCVLKANGWSDRPPLSLAVREHGQPAVEIHGSIHDAKLTLGASARLSVWAGPIALAGFAEPTWVEVHVTRPVAVGSTFVLTPLRDISRDIRHWPRSATEEAQVSIEPPSGIEVSQQSTASIPCSALTMDVRPFDPLAGLRDPNGAKQAALKAGRRAALRERADGPAVAHVTLAARAQPVTLLAREGASAHVAFPRGTLLVHGWVNGDDLEESSAAPQGFVTMATNVDRFDAPTQKEERVCPHDVTLQVMEPKGRVPQKLGRIPTGTRIGIVLWDRALTTIFIGEAGVFPVGDGALVVSTNELDGCTAK